MTREIVYLDLFSGTGGFARGLMSANVNITKHYFSEIDPYAIANYRYNFKDAKYVGDVRDVSGKSIPERPNLITFGFPCQDISVAGKQEGLDGDRSGLFYEAIRIIKETKPDIFIFENVKGLFSSKQGKDFEAVLQAIADIGIYDCEWQLLNTAWVLPQNRERIYFIGHLRGSSRPEVFPFTEADFKPIEGATDSPIVRTLTVGGKSGGHHSSMTLLIDPNYKHRELKIYDKISPTLSARDWKEPKCLCVPVLTPDREKKRQNGRRFKQHDDPAFTLTAQDRHGVLIDRSIRRITEIECERLQGFPDDWTRYGDFDGKIKEISKTQRYKMLGNAVTSFIPQIIADRLSFIK